MEVEKSREGRMIDVGHGDVRSGALYLRSPDGSDCICEPQLESCGRRIDFAITGAGISIVSIAVEVDGYTYHYADQDQASATLSRTRTMVAHAWRVVPSTARDVTRDPDACALEVLRS